MYLTHIRRSNASFRAPGDGADVVAVSSPEDLEGRRFAAAFLPVLRVLSCGDGGLMSRKACRDFWEASLTHLVLVHAPGVRGCVVGDTSHLLVGNTF